MCNRFHTIQILICAVLIGLAGGAHAASIGSTGYTNDFSTLPSAADWSYLNLAGAAANIGTAADLNTAVQAVTASSINTPIGSDPGDPPLLNGAALWSSVGLYLQTRPTGNNAILLMCTLVNNLGGNAASVTISYDFAKVAPAPEEIEGHQAYYSLTGAAGSWVPIPQFSSALPGKLTATLNINWPGGATLYLLWADDNGSPSPDTACQIDNVSITATPAAQTPVTITSQPQSQTVAELSPASFTVGLAGYPPPTIQWYRNNAPITDATNASYFIASAALSDSGAQFKLIAADTASNVNYAVTSSVVVLTVNADTNAPMLLHAFGSPPTTVHVEFSEPVSLESANFIGNYSITSPVGNLTISGAVLAPNGTNVTLTTSAQTIGATYTVIVNGIHDRSVASNQIAPNSFASFTNLSYTATDIGSPQPAGTVAVAGNGYRITVGGADIGGTNDQLTFNYQVISGDFDMKLRVEGLTGSDAWTKAGWMARESLNANSRFAAALATPGVCGAVFESRIATGLAATAAGSFPVNYPNTWLRLQRAGSTFTGFASIDGDNWMRLGALTMTNLPSAMFLGMVVSSHTNGVPTTAEFRDLTQVSGGTVGTVTLPIEPAGPSSRRTPFAITEINYNPFPSTNALGSLEFIEIYNSNPFWEEISGYRLSGDIDYTFPLSTYVLAGQYIVVARNPAALQAAYNLSGVPVFGPYATTNTLKSSGTVRLRNKEDAILLEIPYSSDPPWPSGADGAGHSLVLARPTYGEGSAAAWALSDQLGGSPGRIDGYTGRPQRNVVINEFLANSQDPDVDWIELYNHSNTQVDISGCTLSDEARTNKFVLPANTFIPPRGFLVFYQTQLGFGLSSGGETIYFRDAGGRVLDCVRFEAQAAGVTSGRSPDGATEFYPLTAPTPGAANAGILIRDIVINEIMYKPISGDSSDEYVELYNKGTNAVNLTGWRFNAGIDFTFPSNVVMAPDSYLVIAKDAQHLMGNYANLNSANTLGNFDGSLKNSGERVALTMPDTEITTNSLGQVKTNKVHIVVDEVTYGIGGNWGNWAAEGGSSLELIDPRSNHRLAHNWGDSDETHKAPWTLVEATGFMDNGAGTANLFEVLSLGEGEYLLDDVQVIPSSTGTNVLAAANSNFESGIGGWLPRGTHIRSTLETTEGHNSSRSLHIRASDRGDTQHNRAVVAVPTLPTGGSAQVTLRAYARWLRGWPEILLRVHGNWMEAYGRLTVPTNLGTPGQRNSRAVTNAPPAIYAVQHTPVVPAAGEPVVVTARVHDSDGLASIVLKYRIDPSQTITSVPMLDDGAGGDSLAGDGIYSATITGQSSNTIVAFTVVATDTLGAVRTFPLQDASYKNPFECLVYFGDTSLPTGFGTYRQWMSVSNLNDWMNRPALSNEQLDETFVYGNFRAIYNTRVKWAGSPYHQFGGTPANDGHYVIDMPADNICLGTASWHKVHMPGNGPGDDNTIQREQTCFWWARQMGLPWNYRRCVNMFFNGFRRGGTTLMMEDTETPGNDFVNSRFPDDSNGNLYKLQPWFEVDDGSARSLGFANQSWALMNKFTTSSNGVPVHKTAR